MEDIKRRCKPMVYLLKFAYNKMILSNVVALRYNQFLAKLYPF